MNGWAGKVLRINLDDGVITREPSSKYIKYTGGVGFGYKVIFDEAPLAEPFAPENRLVFAAGPLTGTPAPSSGRTEVISISPHVYSPGSKRALATRSNFGGYWGAELKFAGYDALIVQGKAGTPVYISIHDEKVEIKDAQSLWGLDTFDTQQKIKRIHEDEKVQIVTIGPAGENLARIAPIMHRMGNAAGQGGFGAVMGSKNLKAIAVRGSGQVKVADQKGLIKYIRAVRKMLPMPNGSTPLTKASAWGKYGDTDDINVQALRINQTRILAPYLSEYYVKNVACFSCPTACYAYLDVPGMGANTVSCNQLFYAFFGNQDKGTYTGTVLSNRLGINAFEMAVMVQLLWYLQDTEVQGKSILEHMTDAGLVTEEVKKDLDSGHYPPKGRVSGQCLETVMNMIAQRKGFLGDCLAEGFRRALDILAEVFNKKDHPDIARAILAFENIEGMFGGPVGGSGAWGMSGHYDPRAYGYYWAVNFSMENRDPNRHGMTSLLKWSGLNFEQAFPMAVKTWGRETAENGLSDIHRDSETPLVWNGAKSARANADIARFIHFRGCIKDSLTVCDWLYPVMTSARKDRQYMGDTGIEHKLYAYVTGHEANQEELDRRAAQIWNLHRLLTALEWGGGEPADLRKEHDQIPQHYFNPPDTLLMTPFPPGLPTPHPPLERDKFEAAKSAYYEIMGWDETTGIPKRSTLEDLDMKDVADQFERMAFRLPE